MAFSLSVKLFMAVTLLVMLTLHQAYAQQEFFDEQIKKYLEEHPEMKEQFEAQRRQDEMRRQCPPEFMGFYKECKGTLKTCAQCLSDAERECDRAERIARAEGASISGTCTACTTNFSGRCDAAEKMCFGYQDCGGGELHCINFKCQL